MVKIELSAKKTFLTSEKRRKVDKIIIYLQLKEKLTAFTSLTFYCLKVLPKNRIEPFNGQFLRTRKWRIETLKILVSSPSIQSALSVPPTITSNRYSSFNANITGFLRTFLPTILDSLKWRKLSLSICCKASHN